MKTQDFETFAKLSDSSGQRTITRTIRQDELPERFINRTRYGYYVLEKSDCPQHWIDHVGICGNTWSRSLDGPWLLYTKTIPVPPPGTPVSVDDAREFHAAGVKLEWRLANVPWSSKEYNEMLTRFKSTGYAYRIANPVINPSDFKPGDKVDVETARELRKAGVPLECRSSIVTGAKKWMQVECLLGNDESVIRRDGWELRIAAEPKRVPLGPEDVLDWVRQSERSVSMLVIGVDSGGVQTRCNGVDFYIKWQELVDNGYRHTDKRRLNWQDWTPCWKEGV